MNAKVIGTVVGLVFGVMLFWLGAGAAFAVLALALIGWLIGKLVNREIDIVGYLETISRRKSSR